MILSGTMILRAWTVMSLVQVSDIQYGGHFGGRYQRYTSDTVRHFYS